MAKFTDLTLCDGSGIPSTVSITPLEIMQNAIRAFKHPIRQQMMQLLSDGKEMDVTSIYVKLRSEQSLVSQHLAILRKAGLVIVRTEGKSKIYSNNLTMLQKLNDCCIQFAS